MNLLWCTYKLCSSPSKKKMVKTERDCMSVFLTYNTVLVLDIGNTLFLSFCFAWIDDDIDEVSGHTSSLSPTNIVTIIIAGMVVVAGIKITFLFCLHSAKGTLQHAGHSDVCRERTVRRRHDSRDSLESVSDGNDWLPHADMKPA